MASDWWSGESRDSSRPWVRILLAENGQVPGVRRDAGLAEGEGALQTVRFGAAAAAAPVPERQAQWESEVAGPAGGRVGPPDDMMVVGEVVVVGAEEGVEAAAEDVRGHQECVQEQSEVAEEDAGRGRRWERRRRRRKKTTTTTSRRSGRPEEEEEENVKQEKQEQEEDEEEERQPREKTEEAEEKGQVDGEGGIGSRQPRERQCQEAVLRPATSQDPLTALALLESELCSLTARDTRAFWRLKRRMIAKRRAVLDPRRAIVRCIPGFWAQAVSFPCWCGSAWAVVWAVREEGASGG